MPDIDVTFDPRKIGRTENPITVSPAVLHLPPGTRQHIRFTLRTIGAESTAAFDLTPAVFDPGSPLRLDEPVPMGATSFSIVDENRNRDPLPQRLCCILWIRYAGQSYPALYPTMVNEPLADSRPAPADLVDAVACAA